MKTDKNGQDATSNGPLTQMITSSVLIETQSSQYTHARCGHNDGSG